MCSNEEHDALSTSQYAEKMTPYVEEMLGRIWPGRVRLDRKHTDEDIKQAIDSRLQLPDGPDITVQEKVRGPDYFYENRVDPTWPDFCQEWINAQGTRHERDGEWFYLAAMYVFYCWGNEAGDGLRAWALLDVAEYRAVVKAAGGWSKLGNSQKNRKFGSSVFYAAPMYKFHEAIVWCQGLPEMDELKDKIFPAEVAG